MAAAFDHEMAAGICPLFGFVDGKQLELAGPLISDGARGIKAKATPLKFKRDFVAGHAFLFGLGIGQDEHRIAFQKGKIGRAHKHTAQVRLAADEIEQAEFGAFGMFGQQNFPHIKAVEILAVPFAMIVAFAGEAFLNQAANRSLTSRFN